MLKKITFIFFYIACFISVIEATPYSTRSYSDQINSIRTIVEENLLSEPVILLGSSQTINISFDLISYEYKTLDYKIIHCNADWTPSDISSMEYVDGFDNGTFEDYDYSINTTTNYIHYNINFPNENTKLTKSGNYVLIIAEDYNYDEPLATICFSVSEEIIPINGRISGNTLYEISGKYQQLEIEIDHSTINTTTPANEFIISIEQNGRLDNSRLISQPTYTHVNKLIYRDRKELIFEGGNSYRSVDFSSEYTYGAGIERIQAIDNIMHVILEPSLIRSTKSADQSYHANGKYIINRQSANDDDIESDYMWVHFWLPMENPMLNGSLFIIGDFVRNIEGGQLMMDYDFENKAYFARAFLKQGGYNFMYAFSLKNSNLLTLIPIEGSYWQTSNSYIIKVFHKAFGERYERLLAVKRI